MPSPFNAGRVEVEGAGGGGGDIVNPEEQPHRTSQFKGVSWAKANGKWRAQCKGRRLGQGLTLVHFSAQLEHCLTHKHTLQSPKHHLNTP